MYETSDPQKTHLQSNLWDTYVKGGEKLTGRSGIAVTAGMLLGYPSKGGRHVVLLPGRKYTLGNAALTFDPEDK